MKYGFKEYVPGTLLRGHLALGGESPAGGRIEVNSRYIEKDGKPFIGVMGEFHFVRCERAHWYEELCKMKAGGIGIVASYLFWIYHEEEEGCFDFTGVRDVRGFVEEAKRAGLSVFLRIGPWAHGECRNGGFPDWLLKKPYPLRENNPDYLAKVRVWYEKIYEQVQGLFYQDGGNIIGIQLENELVGNAEHLLALKRIAQESGLIAPLYTVTGWNSKYGARIPTDEVLPVFGGYPEAPWTQHTEPLPPSHNFAFCTMRNDSAIGTDVMTDPGEADNKEAGQKTDSDGWRLPYERYPFATCELGGGIQVTHHRRPIIRPMDIYALSLVKLGSGNNLIGYYMYHGGTNQLGKHSSLNESRETGYPNDYTVLSYDFQAPLSEYGEAREHYGLLNMLHLFAEDFGALLAPMEAVEAVKMADASDRTSLRYIMRTDGCGSGFVFINHYQRLEELAPVENAQIEAPGVCFPPIDVKGKTAFFLPFGMELKGTKLHWATAQPLCRVGDTYFFVAIEGILPRYQFADGEVYTAETGAESGFVKNGSRIVILSFEEARFARRLRAAKDLQDGSVQEGNERFVIGLGCDLYEMDGEIRAVQDGSFEYLEWTKDCFVRHHVEREFTPAQAVWETVDKPPFALSYPQELSIGGPRKLTWKKVRVTGAQGYIEITEDCDAAQLYADGKLAADQFYIGVPWRVPARLLFGKECYLVTSERKDDFYREF